MRNFLYAIRLTGTRTREALTDPARRRHLLSRFGEGLVGGAAAVIGWYWLGVAGLLAAPLAEFAIYEYLIEPLARGHMPSWAGPYWERGPRDGETFINP